MSNSVKPELKVVLAGSVDSGKSTTLGCMVSGQLDNGRGHTRSMVFNYAHESASGRTSSVAHHLMGFDAESNPVFYNDSRWNKAWPYVVKHSTKLVSFYDMAGHESYLKTTFSGISSMQPDLALIMVGANMGLPKITLEHIQVCFVLKIPFAIVITKMDICANRIKVLEHTVKQIVKAIKGNKISKKICMIKSQKDIEFAQKTIYTCGIVPIFGISNTTGLGHDKLRTFLLGLEPKCTPDSNGVVRCYTDSRYQINGVETVLCGYLDSGTVRVGDKLYLGPIGDFSNEEVTIRSIHNKRVPVDSVSGGRYVCLGIKRANTKTKLNWHKGLLISSENIPGVRTFQAEVRILKETYTTIKIGFEPIIYINNIRQACKLTDCGGDKDNRNRVLRSGSVATVTCRFRFRPAHVKVGDKLFFTEGRIRAIGNVTQVVTGV